MVDGDISQNTEEFIAVLVDSDADVQLYAASENVQAARSCAAYLD
jgi:hypothetical protein